MKAAAFLVSVKLILVGAKNTLSTRWLQGALEEIKSLQAVARGETGR